MEIKTRETRQAELAKAEKLMLRLTVRVSILKASKKDSLLAEIIADAKSILATLRNIEPKTS